MYDIRKRNVTLPALEFDHSSFYKYFRKRRRKKRKNIRGPRKRKIFLLTLFELYEGDKYRLYHHDRRNRMRASFFSA